MSDYQVGDTLYFKFTTRAFATGVPTVLGNTPVISVYEDDSITQITAGVSLTVDLDGVVGLNLATIVATGANGFGAGQFYSVVITTGTVASVSVIGEVVKEFTLDASAAALDLANGTDGLGQLSSDIGAIPTTAMRGTDIGNLNDVSTGDLAAALVAIGLDHWTFTAASIPAVTPGTFLDQLFDDGTATYDRTTDSLQAIRDHATTIKSETALIVADTNELQLDDTPGAISGLNDPTAGAIADQVWNEAQADHVSAGSFGITASEIAAIPTTVMRGTDDGATAANLSTLDTTVGNLNDLSAAQVNTEVDTALNTAIPGGPTADSINQRILAIDDLTQASGAGDLAAILTDTSTTLDNLVDDLETRIPDTISLANINAEVVDVMATDTIAEQSQGIPSIAPTTREAIMYLYMAWRNDSQSTATNRSIRNNAGTRIAQSTMADDATTFNQGRMGSGA